MNKPTAVKRFIFLFVFMLIGFALTFCTFDIPFTNYTYHGFANSIKLGLDLKGGVLAVYDASPLEDDSDADFNSQLTATVARLKSILTNEGFSEAQVSIQQGTRIRVEVPDVEDPEEVFALIGEPAELEFKLTTDGDARLTGKHIQAVEATYGPTSSSSEYEWGVAIKFNAEGAALFHTLTQEAVAGAGQIYIFANGEQISAPTVKEAIAGGSTIISGSYDQKSAENFALQIMSGTFSVQLTLSESAIVSATLGVNALQTGLIAGGLGVLFIFAFMIWRYRMMGALASFALCFYIVLMLFFLQAIPLVQLSLEGIAGIILSIGMAIDANIIIFERIKEEYASGKRLAPSIRTGFRRGLPAILDSNITTLISCLILMFLGTGSIQGFAVTLFIGVALSMFSSLIITRGLLNMYYPINSTKPERYSLKRGALLNETTK